MSVKTLVRHSSHYITGQVCVMAIGLVSFPIFTRVLSVPDYGMMELVQRLALVGTAAGKLGVQHAILRFYQPKEFEADPAAARRFVSTSVFGSSATALLAGVLAALAFWLFGGKGNPAVLALLTAILAAIRALNSILLSIVRMEQKAALANWMGVAGRAATVATIFALFALWRPDLRLYFSGTVVIEFLAVAFFIWLLLRRHLVAIPSFDRDLYKQMVAFGLPMVAYETLIVALDSSDRFLIRNMVGATPLGYYAAAYAICTYIQDILMVPINMAMMPIYMRLWNTDGPARTAEFLSDSFRLFIMAASCLVAGVAACASSAVLLLASAKYATSARLIPWIVCGLVAYAATAFFNAPLWIEKKTKTMAWLVGITLVVKTVLNLLLLPTLGLFGAVASSITGYLILMIMTIFASRRAMKIHVDLTLTAKSIACAALAGFAGLQIELAAPAAELIVRAAVVFTVFAASLIVVDRVARETLLRGWSTALRALNLAPAGGIK